MANDKISLNALIEEAEAAKLSLNAYLLPQSAAELEITEEELLAKMAQMLKVMEEAAAYGLTGVRSHSGLTGGSALKLQNAAAQPGFNKLLGALATDAVTYALAVSECTRRAAGFKKALQFNGRTAGTRACCGRANRACNCSPCLACGCGWRLPGRMRQCGGHGGRRGC